eukprot:gene11345-15210_t
MLQSNTSRLLNPVQSRDDPTQLNGGSMNSHIKSNYNKKALVTLPRIDNNSESPSTVDVSLLDLMGLEEFLSLLKNKTESNSKELWKASCSLAMQLKASRELLSISSTLFSQKSTKKILSRLVDATYTILNAERVHLMEIDKNSRELIVTHTHEENTIGYRIPVNKGIEGDVVTRKICANVPDVTHDPRYLPTMELKIGQKVRCLVCAPIIYEGVVIGVIQAINKLGDLKTHSPRDSLTFNTNDALMLSFIATNAGLAIKQSNSSSATPDLPPLTMYSNPTIARHDINSVTTNGLVSRQATSNSLENDINFKILLDLAYTKLDAERVSIFTYSATSKTLVCAVSPDIKGFSIPKDQGIAGSSFSSVRIINVLDCAEDERWFQEFDKRVGYTTRNVLSAPILDSIGLPIGVIQAVNKKSSSSFSSVDEENILELGKKIAAFLKQKEANEQQHQQLSSFTSLPTVDSVTFARLVANMLISTSIEELIDETKRAIQTLTDCDVMNVYALENDCLIQIQPFKVGKVDDFQPIKLEECSSQVKYSLQFQTTVEYYDHHVSPSSVLSANNIGDKLMPNLNLQSAMIVPIQSRPYGYNPGNCLAVVANSKDESTFSSSKRDLVEIIITEFFSNAMKSISDKICNDEHMKTLKNNFYLVNHTLATIKDYIILLGADGGLIACNKNLDHLLGQPQAKTGSVINNNNASIIEGMHYSQWLTPLNSKELFIDIQAALFHNKSGSHESIKFITPLFPDGIIIDYQVVPLPEPDFIHNNDNNNNNNNNTDSTSTHTTDLNNNTTQPHAIIIVLCMSKNRATTENNREFLKELNLVTPIDPTSAQGVVEAAHAILKNVKNSFNLDDETKSALSNIAKELSNTTRRMSITSVTHSAISMAAQSLKTPLVDPMIELPSDLFEWEFNVLTISNGVILCNIIGKLFETLFNFSELNIDPSTMARYIMEVGKHYHDRPFHNLQHATCVTHFTHMLIKAAKAMDQIKTHQVFGIMVSALVHDVDHPGNTNLFEINSGSELALKYNDQSVLENHHCSTAFRIMRKQNTNILAGLSKPLTVEIRRIIIACVMATDMAVHFELIDETKKRALNGWNFSEAKDQALLGKILLHAADLSNPVRPFHMTRQWAERISVEFNDQVSREQALGMPVLGFMMTPDEKAFCKNETGFASFVVAPMWRSIAMLYPHLNFLVEQLDSNIQVWKSLLESIAAAEEKENSSK